MDSGLYTLLQHGKPVAFASRSLSSVEQCYAQIEKETLAVVFACEHFRQYICGRDITHIQTDHKPLETIFNSRCYLPQNACKACVSDFNITTWLYLIPQVKTRTLLISFHVHHCPSDRQIELCQKMCLRHIC